MNSIESGICLVITSCGRMQLLERTLESFGRFNTHTIDQVVLVEDSGLEIRNTWLANLLKVPIDIITIITNESNIGQFRSIDLAYSHVQTDFIFHLEDDWVFHSPGFLEDSLDIIQCDDNISCVWLRALDDTNDHPIEPSTMKTPSGKFYRYLVADFLGIWSGFTFNPGLRRTKLMREFMPFSALELLDFSIGNDRQITESDISIHFGRRGYRAVIVNKRNGYLSHIGYGYHLAQAFETPIRVYLRNTFFRLRKKWKKTAR